jgi:hypothetical protein
MYGPALVVVIDYPTLGVMQSTLERAASEKEFSAAWRAFETAELPYVRYESTLLKAFDNHPENGSATSDEKRPARIFELRTYESRNAFSLRGQGGDVQSGRNQNLPATADSLQYSSGRG